MKLYILLVAALVLAASNALAANYIEPDELKQAFQQKRELIIVDIQPAEQFEQHHFNGSIETNAFPAKTEQEKKRLDKALPVIKASGAPVIVVCPRGKSGAKNSYEYLAEHGVPEERLQILEDGMGGWPFKEYIRQGR
ncbi:MAG TPA: rhodanese-like domain-containing protein [Desulfuromonadaceae bacterium]